MNSEAAMSVKPGIHGIDRGCGVPTRMILVQLVLSAVAAARAAADESIQRADPPYPAPMCFIENRGQWTDGSAFLGVSSSLTLRVAPWGFAVVGFDAAGKRGTVLEFRAAGFGAGGVKARESLPTRFHFFRGADPNGWVTHARSVSAVSVENDDAGVSIEFRSSADGFEYAIVSEGGGQEASGLSFEVRGNSGLALGPAGELLVETEIGTLAHSAPRAWLVSGEAGRTPVASTFEVLDAHTFRLHSPNAPSGSRWVIDPGLMWSTFHGGTQVASQSSGGYSPNLIQDAAPAPDGGTVVVGETQAPDFPITPGAFDVTFGGKITDGFVSKFQSDGTLAFSTFLGADSTPPIGGGNDQVLAVAVKPDGSIVLSGKTQGSGFPLTPGAIAPSVNLGAVFVTHMAPTGDAIWLSAMPSWAQSDNPRFVGVAPDETFVVIGSTAAGFVTTSGAYDSTYGGDGDCFALRLAADGSSVIAATYLGSWGSDAATCGAIRVDGSIVLAGVAGSAFPLTANAFDTSFAPGEGFVAVLDASLQDLLFSSYLGGISTDGVRALQLDAAGRIVAGGETVSPDFPTTPGAYQESCSFGCGNAFVSIVDPSNGTLVASTLFGSLSTDLIVDLGVDAAGNVIFLGDVQALADTMPVTPGAYQTTIPGGCCGDAFVGKFDRSLRKLLYCTFLGGSEEEPGLTRGRIAVDPTGVATVAMKTFSSDYPITPGAIDPIYDPKKTVVTRLDLLATGLEIHGTSTPGCRGPLGIGATSMPWPTNESFALTAMNAEAGTVGLLAASPNALSTPLALSGAWLWLDPAGLLVVPVVADDYGSVEFPIPIRGTIPVGTTAYVQVFFLDLCAPLGLASTPALEVVVQPAP